MRRVYNTFQKKNKTDGLDKKSLEKLQQQFVASDRDEDNVGRGFKRSDSTMSLPNFATVKQTDSTSEDNEGIVMGTRRDRRKDDQYYIYQNTMHIDNNGTHKQQHGSFSGRGKDKEQDKKPTKLNGRYSQV